MLVAFVLGALAAVAFPPVSVVVILLPTLSGLVWLIHDTRKPRTAFAVGWAFGLGHFCAGLYWIGNAFLVDATRHAALAAPAVIGLAAVLAIYVGVVCALYRRCVNRPYIRLPNLMVFASLWTLGEWVRAWAFTGFPWNLMGSAWIVSDAMLQLGALGGVYLLSLLTVACAILPVLLICGDPARLRYSRVAVACGILLLLAVWGGGTMRLAGATQDYVPDVQLRLVQPNIAQNLKWQRDLRGAHVVHQMALSLQDGVADKAPTHVIWAETAAPFVVPRNPDIVPLLSRAAPRGGALITGILRGGAPQDGEGRPAIWNSLLAVTSDGRVAASYDKSHLVPFGEYVPFAQYLPLEKLTAGGGGFSFGTGQQTLEIPGLPPVSPLICYEIIFPGAAIRRDARPDWILNITNDAWYGNSAGPYQHFAAARLRAVEEGLPVIRVANTGISGVIDAYGRVEQSLPLGQAGILNSGLPSAGPITPYARYGSVAIIPLCALLFGVGLWWTFAIRR